MRLIPTLRNAWSYVVPAALLAVAIHLIHASLIELREPWGERIFWAVLAAAALSAMAARYPTLPRHWQGLIAAGVGLPALVVGLGIHAVHVAQLGVHDSDFTGLPMLVAGVVLFISGTTALVRLIYTWWRRLLLLPLVPVLGFYVLFPMILVTAITNVAGLPVESTPADHGLAYEEVTFETPQGRELGAWFIPPKNGAVVITVHGAGSNRSKVMDEAAMLGRHGYGLLMIDVEGFGESDGQSNGFGWVGARDVHAAVDYLQSRSDVDPQRIGGLGLSMGGEVMLHAAGESGSLKAVVAEGATGRTAKDFSEYSKNKAILPFHVVVGQLLEVVTGEDSPPPLKQLVQQIAPRDVLLIGSQVPEEKELMSMYHRLGGPSFELWLIPEAKHVGAFDLHREEYERRVVQFFNESLLAEPELAVR